MSIAKLVATEPGEGGLPGLSGGSYPAKGGVKPAAQVGRLPGLQRERKPCARERWHGGEPWSPRSSGGRRAPGAARLGGRGPAATRDAEWGKRGGQRPTAPHTTCGDGARAKEPGGRGGARDGPRGPRRGPQGSGAAAPELPTSELLLYLILGHYSLTACV